jgi:hypothetical protein
MFSLPLNLHHSFAPQVAEAGIKATFSRRLVACNTKIDHADET